MSVVQTAGPSRASFAVRAVERLSGLLGGHASTRRSFLFRAAVVGSALAVDPVGYALKPGTAYASVCGRSSTCSGGWSVFCCTINDGANTCPDYSYVAGWWKVDASAFCLGAPRYYIDCNRRPGGSCRCRCNNRGGCDRRRTCCNVFRYGQCNTQITGVTAVVCRIVTCTPPWEWDRNCGRTVRTSESTRTHSSACLPGTNPSRIELKYQDLGLVGSFLGAPAGREQEADREGRKRDYDKGMILWHRDHGAHEVHGWLARRYRRSGAETGPLGFPRTDHRPVGDRSGQVVRFERGSMYRRFGGPTTIVLGRVDRHYRKLGGPRGGLGYPTADTASTTGGTETAFERGAIYKSPATGAVAVLGRIAQVYADLGGPGGTGLGFPVAPQRSLNDGGHKQRFEHGLIIGPSPKRVFVVREPIRHRYMGEMDGPDGPWGHPITHTGAIAGRTGLWIRFQRAVVYWSPETGAHWFERGTIYRRYRVEGGAGGWLGFPTTDQEVTSDGRQVVTFQNGTISYDPASGAVEVG